jgi:predicted nucleic acid-binding protein
MPSDSPRLVLVDSNVLVYAVDESEQTKGIRANGLLDALGDAAMGIITPQIVAEFYSVATRPRGGRSALLDARAAEAWVNRWLSMLACVPLTEAIAREAVRGAREHQMSIFDAQIWASAKLSGADVVLTEDDQSAEFIEGVRFINPFEQEFLLEHIGL